MAWIHLATEGSQQAMTDVLIFLNKNLVIYMQPFHFANFLKIVFNTKRMKISRRTKFDVFVA